MDDGVEHLSPNFYRFLDGSFRRLPRVPGSPVIVRLKAAMKYRLNTWWLWRQIFGKTHGMREKKIPGETKENHRKNRNTHRKAWVFFEKQFIFWYVCFSLIQIQVHSVSKKVWWPFFLTCTSENPFSEILLELVNEATNPTNSSKKTRKQGGYFWISPTRNDIFFWNDFSELISNHLHVI